MTKIVLFGIAALGLAVVGCGGTSGTDAGTPTDTGAADTGTPPQDTGMPPQDTGMPPQDTGMPPQDTGMPPQDTGMPPQDTGMPPQDTGMPPADSGGGFMMLHDCAEAMYEDRTGATAMRVVTNVGSSSYTPRCMTISAGQAVTFMSSFGAHPLRPGLRGMPAAGSPMNPITPQDSGSMAMITFPRAGFYPFYCDFHFGMVGVIRVR
jgi:plastocyanin